MSKTQIETPAQYVQEAIRTDLDVDNLQVNRDLLYFVLNVLLNTGEVLDQIKKNTFYGRPVDADKLIQCSDRAQQYAKQMHAMLQTNELSEQAFDNNKTDFNTIDSKVFHSIVGLTTEAVELLEPLYENLTDEKPVDVINLLEEYGDVNWYEALGINAVDGNFEDVLGTNIDKLKARFPEKFTAENANNRDTDAERNILESGFSNRDN